MLCFGSVTCKNFNGDLRNVANVAENSKNQNVRVQILRNGQVIITSYIKKKTLYFFKNSLEPKNMFIKVFFSDLFQTMTLALKPQVWSGRGLVGCHMVPIKYSEETLDR